MENKPLRIVMLSHNYFPYIGGVESMLASICPRLISKGLSLFVLTRRSTKSPRFEHINGVPVYRLPSPGPKIFAAPIYIFSALWMLLRLKPDIVHAHIMFSPATIGLLAKLLFNARLVITVHRGGLAPSGEIARLQQKFFGDYRLALFRKYTDRFIVISSEIEAELDAVGVSATIRTFITNGIDTSRFVPLPIEKKRNLRKELGLPDLPTVIFAGRLSKEKRVHHLLAIWPSLRTTRPDARLLIVGAGPEEASLRKMAGDGVTFIGGVNDVRPYLQAADLFILPSVAEGLSVALLEAMSAGLPVITTRLGKQHDLVVHGKNGWLISPDDVPALQNAVLSLLNDPVLGKTLGREARDHVTKHFGLDTITDKLFVLYKELQAEKPWRAC